MDNREREVYKVTLTGTAVNAILIVLKFIAGILGRSSAMVADAVHSLSDFITDVIVLVFVKIAGKPSDKKHEYGHGKYETMATLIIGLMLAFAGIGLLVSGADKLVKSFNGEQLPRPGIVALVIAILSIISKEWLYRYTVKAGKKLDSQAVVANAWHHRSDAISSVGTLIGISGAMFLGEQWRILDPLAAIVVSALIIKSGYDIMRPTIGELLEASLPEAQEDEIKKIVCAIPGIENIHRLRTRRVGNIIAIDFHVKMNGKISLYKAHELVTRAENAIKDKFGAQTMVTAHMEPLSDKDD